MERRMEKEFGNIQMVLYLMENGKMEKDLEEGSKHSQVVIHTMENG